MYGDKKNMKTQNMIYFMGYVGVGVGGAIYMRQNIAIIKYIVVII